MDLAKIVCKASCKLGDVGEVIFIESEYRGLVGSFFRVVETTARY